MNTISKAIRFNALKGLVGNTVYAARLEKILNDDAFEKLFDGIIDKITITDPEKLLSNKYPLREDRTVLYDTAKIVDIDYITGDFRVTVKAATKKYYKSKEDFGDLTKSYSTKSEEHPVEHWETYTLSTSINVYRVNEGIEVSYI